jgi:hypothetical protein
MFSKKEIKEAIEQEVIVGDGHTLFGPTFYSTLVEESVLRDAGLIRTHVSDTSSPTSTIFDRNGNVIEKLDAIHNLAFLYWIAKKVEVEYPSYGGRGTQARAIVEALDEWSRS